MVRSGNLIAASLVVGITPLISKQVYAETLSMKPYAENMQLSEQRIAVGVMKQSSDDLIKEAKSAIGVAEALSKLPKSDEIENCAFANVRLSMIALRSASGRTANVLLEVAQYRRDYAYFAGECEKASGLPPPAQPNLR